MGIVPLGALASNGSGRAQAGNGRDVRALVTEHQTHLMRAAVIDERNGAGVDRRAVQFRLGDPSAPALRVRDGDLVKRSAKAPDDRVAGPGRRDTGGHLEGRAAAPEPEDALEARPG